MALNWTEKRVLRLKLLWKEGFSTSAIAKKLGPAFTVGAVAGKIRRLDLSKKPSKARHTKKAPLRAKASPAAKTARAANVPAAPKKVAVKPAPKPAVAKPAPKPAPEPITIRPSAAAKPAVVQSPPPTGIRLFDLREGHCRWPLDDGRSARFFCGAPTVGTSSWCELHQRVVFVGYGRNQHQPRTRAAVGK